MEHLDNFRNEVKVWLDDNCPPSMRTGADQNSSNVNPKLIE